MEMTSDYQHMLWEKLMREPQKGSNSVSLDFVYSHLFCQFHMWSCNSESGSRNKTSPLWASAAQGATGSVSLEAGGAGEAAGSGYPDFDFSPFFFFNPASHNSQIFTFTFSTLIFQVYKKKKGKLALALGNREMMG